ncbi:phosphotransferase [Haloparvum sedimenti]|uniref:phosphotransferase n=1 Tax=Haloparvum sedimenti TaxID=1678448 RepID=UPI00071E6FE6|nr:phosphotransferase [Haloparvum sedimenti]
MSHRVRNRLSSQFDSHGIVRQLHDVPPHEVYEVVVDGRRAVYKGDTGPTGNAGIEGRVIDFVGRETSVPVPETLLVADGYYVAAWRSDAPGPDEQHHADETWAHAAGRGLATLHAETRGTVDRYGRFDAEGGELAIDGDDSWHDAALAYVRRHRPILARHGHADVANAVLDHLVERPSLLDGADEPVCCHGWATPEHVAVADGRVACLVDFEHAVAAPGEFDYWRTSMPTFGPEPGELRRRFREGYESVRSLPAGFDARRPAYVLLNLVYYFESLYVQEQRGRTETAKRAEMMRDEVFAILDELP